MTQHDKNLPKRKLGAQGLQVGAIGLGTMGMTMAYGAADEPGGIATKFDSVFERYSGQ
jgi:aryl-alcohol dehydrogenase-like predicted oxidoreductase